MHLDEEAGKASILGGLAASGFGTAMLCACQRRSAGFGAGLPRSNQWKKPVLAGDTLTGSTIIASACQIRPQLGPSQYARTFNQRGESVFELENSVMFLTRDAAGNAA